MTGVFGDRRVNKASEADGETGPSSGFAVRQVLTLRSLAKVGELLGQLAPRLARVTRRTFSRGSLNSLGGGTEQTPQPITFCRSSDVALVARKHSSAP